MNLGYGAWGGFEDVTFTLIAENGDFAGINNLIFLDSSDPSLQTPIFFGADGVGTTRSILFPLGSYYQLSLLTDFSGNGIYDPSDGDTWLNSIMENSLPDLVYIQPFTAYSTYNSGYADYFYDNDHGGGFNFSGVYDNLIFVEDMTGLNSDRDHDDMVFGITLNRQVVSEPTTLLLLGLGLMGIGALRRSR